MADQADAATINSKVADAIAAMSGGDYATAKARLLEAKAALAGIPDSSIAGATELKWDRAAIDSLLKDVKAEAGSTAGIQRQPYRHIQPSS